MSSVTEGEKLYIGVMVAATRGGTLAQSARVWALCYSSPMGGQRRRRRRRRMDRAVPLTAEARRAFEEQFEAFKRKFGREPGPNDPVFFDPDADSPKPIELDKYLAEIVDVMAKTGMDPAAIYAFRRTGLIVTTENEGLLSEDERQAWRSALDEYEKMTKGKPS